MKENNRESFKLLVTGDVKGNFKTLIERISVVIKKSGPFHLLICVGEFFGSNAEKNRELLDGSIKLPIATYICGPCSAITSIYYTNNGAELAHNLTYVGRSGIFKTVDGLQIAYLSGIEGKKSSDFEFDQDMVTSLVAVSKGTSYVGVDLFITSMWPMEVAQHSSNVPVQAIEGSSLVSKAAALLKPRYHFAGMGSHFERSPYRNHQIHMELAEHVTRFVGLAPVNNTERQKWLYGFSIIPMCQLTSYTLTAQPSNTTEFPYRNLLARMEIEENRAKRKRLLEYYDITARMDDSSGHETKRNRKDASVTITPANCWFCLSNANFEKHLVITLANHSYISFPKGPLCDDHLMIHSIEHVQSLASSSQELRDEIKRFVDALFCMYNRKNKLPVIFERNYKTQHLQVNIVPVPKSSANALRSSFINASKSMNVDLIALNDDEQIWDVVHSGQPYFYLELPNGSRYYSTKVQNLPLQFAREVLAGRQFLDCGDKIDWRSCGLLKDKECELVSKIQNDFRQFDFTVEDDD